MLYLIDKGFFMSTIQIKQGQNLYFFNKNKQMQIVAHFTLDEAVAWLNTNNPGMWVFMGNVKAELIHNENKERIMSEKNFIPSLKLILEKFVDKLSETEFKQLKKIIHKLDS